MSQIPYLLYTSLHGGHRFPQFGTCGGLPPHSLSQGTIPETLTCYIYIYDHIYVEAAL